MVEDLRMKKRTNRSGLLLLLCALTVSVPLASCGEAASVPPAADTTAAAAAETTAETTAETEVTDRVPELDFDGKEFRIASSQNTFYNGQANREELDGDVLNDAMYTRNREAESRFNVVITEYSEKAATVLTQVRNTITAGDEGYHTMMIADRSTFGFALEGMLYEYGDIPYVDLDQPYWSQLGNGNMTIRNKLYGAFGDFSLPALDYTHLIAFNTAMVGSYGLESPYDKVKADKWTLDAFSELGKAVLTDVNGDGQWGPEDVYGHVGRPGLTFPNFWIASDALTVRKDGDGIPYFSAPGDEKLVTIYEKVRRILYDDGVFYAKTEDTNTYYEKTTLFQDDQSLFADHTFYTVSRLRDMDTDFGIVPYPKWDEAQDGYRSWVEGGCQTISVPINTPDLELSGALLEALCASSFRDVIPAYYEIALKQKYTRDTVSAEMFDTIRASRTFDLGDTFWCDTIRTPLARLITTGADLTSFLEANRTKIDATIAKALEFFS